MLSAARLRGTEFVGMAGGALLVAGLFLPWYGTDAANPHSQVHGRTGSLTGWDVHPILRWLLIGAASARPGDIGVSPRVGLLAALLATVTMVGAAARRSSESERPRKPPGTI